MVFRGPVELAVNALPEDGFGLVFVSCATGREDTADEEGGNTAVDKRAEHVALEFVHDEVAKTKLVPADHFFDGHDSLEMRERNDAPHTTQH
ncbi:hypothetical protein DYB32_005129 [Aphanomyces invadans]|uniref:Uncharacterized protein n=1 Tax=Aphanomyces invadans TaxID=157072 RepID=A0A3R6Z3U5_9STRA|nr:hypothetical protein DYB32_005129 [Aphanomyces invadans]